MRDLTHLACIGLKYIFTLIQPYYSSYIRAFRCDMEKRQLKTLERRRYFKINEGKTVKTNVGFLKPSFFFEIQCKRSVVVERYTNIVL